MVAPLILKVVAFSVAKKVVVFLVAKLYGFPRLYRRASEFNHYINRNNPKRREKFKSRLQFLFRLPSHIYETVQRWRGVQPPQGPPSAATGHSQGTTSSHLQQKQVREIHTRSGAGRVVSSLNVPNPSSSLSGLGAISQSIKSHLLGLRGGPSRTRPFSGSCTLPFGVASLISPQIESMHFSRMDSHDFQIKPPLQDSHSGRFEIGEICGATSCRCVSMISIIQEELVAAKMMQRFKYSPNNSYRRSSIEVKGFVKENSAFIVTDKLEIIPSTINSSLSLLKKLGFASIDDPESSEITVSITQIVELLHSALISKKCLNDVFGKK